MQDPPRSFWGLAGFGCVALIVVSVVAFVAFIVVGNRMARSVRAQAADPELRLASARELLRTAELPEDYAPVLGVSVPLLGQVVVLERPEPLGIFLYLHGPSGLTPERDDRLRRLLDVRGVALEKPVSLAEGEIAEAGRTLLYRSVRAHLAERPHGERSVLAALVEVRCGMEAETTRLGVWIESDPDSWLPPDDLDFAGTPADPQAIQTFFAAFDLC